MRFSPSNIGMSATVKIVQIQFGEPFCFLDVATLSRLESTLVGLSFFLSFFLFLKNIILYSVMIVKL